jgi:hypothetical protein
MVSACRPAKRQQASLPTHRPPDGAYLASAASSRILLRSISAEDGSRIIFHVKERRLERPAELGSAREPSKLNVAWRRMEVPPTPPVRSRNAVPSCAPGFSTCIEHPMEEHLGWQARRARRPNLGLAIAPHHRGLKASFRGQAVDRPSRPLFSRNLECSRANLPG